MTCFLMLRCVAPVTLRVNWICLKIGGSSQAVDDSIVRDISLVLDLDNV